MIESVHLRDFKSHEDTVVRFQPGANALLGQNGAGKTSVLQAIGFCLFDAGPKRGTEWHRKGTKGGKVTVTFHDKNGTRHAVERRLGSTSGIKLLGPDGVLLATSKDEVYLQLRGLLGLDPTEDLAKLWNELIGVPQGHLTAAFGTTAMPRRAVFDAVLRVDDYKAASDQLKPTHDHAKQRVDEARDQCTILATRLEGAKDRLSTVQALSKQCKAQKTVVSQSEKAVHASEAALAKANARLEAAKALQDAAKEAATALATAQSQHKAMTDRLAEANQSITWLTSHKDRIDRLAAATQLLEQDAESIQNARAAVTEHTQLQAQIPALQQRINAAKQQIATLRKQLEEAPDFDALRVEESALLVKLADAKADEQQRNETVRAHRQTQDEARRNEAERLRLEAQAQSVAGQSISQAATIAAQAARSQLDGLRQLAGALDAQFEMLAEDQVCPILDLTCPVADERVGNRRLARQADLSAEVASIQSMLAGLDEAANAEKASNALVEKARHDQPRLEVLQQQHQVAMDVAAKALPEAHAALEHSTNARVKLESEIQSIRQHLAKESTLLQLRPAIASQSEALQKDQQDIGTLQARQHALSKLSKEHSTLDAAAKEAELLLRTERSFAQDLVVHQRTAATKEERERAVADAAEARQAATVARDDRVKQAAEAWSPDDDAHLKALQTQDRQTRDTLTRQVTELTGMERDLNAWAEAVKSDEATRVAHLEAEQDLAKCQRIERVADRVRKLIKELGPVVAERFTEHVSVAADDWFRQLNGGRPARLQWHNDYDITVTDQDGHLRTFSDLSGGEQVMAALSVRLSLLQSLSPVPFSIYDEPTANLDDEVRHNVARVLEQAGTAQILVVSHDDAFSESIHNAVRLEKQGTRSVIAEEYHA